MNQKLAAWLIKKIQKYGPRKVRVMGDTFRFSEHVFNPGFYFTSRFMAKHLELKPEDYVLDMGTGSGILAVKAARVAAKVVAVDINTEAVKYARKNVKANGMEGRVDVLEGDLFEPVKGGMKFDVILFNPPYLEGIPEIPIDHALFDPGQMLIRRFLLEAKGFLKPYGYVQILYSSIADRDFFASEAQKSGWIISTIAEEGTITEKFSIYRLKPSN